MKPCHLVQNGLYLYQKKLIYKYEYPLRGRNPKFVFECQNSTRKRRVLSQKLVETLSPMHKCHAVGCNSQIDAKNLMCDIHWAMVPPMLQAKINSLYKPGQEIDGKASKQYLQAATEAIAIVAQQTVV